MRKVAGNLGGPVVLLGIGKAGGGRLHVELLTCTMVRVVGGLIGVGGHKVLVVGPLTKSIMVILIEIAGLQGIALRFAQGLRRRGIVDALQVKRTGAS
jgi:Na+/glutamate symporter